MDTRRIERDLRRRRSAPSAAPGNGQALFAQRAFFGRDLAKSAVLNLGDRAGKTRLRLVVDSVGVASIEFLDESGQVRRRIGADQ
jgi:hypothetical protein